jgi:hypothetical protein
MASHELIRSWRQCQLNNPPFVLPQDSVLLYPKYRKNVTICETFDEYIHSAVFGQQVDHTAHLGLIPTPYMGNLARADVFILMMNPGLQAANYYVEEKDANVRAALQNNLFQRGLDKRYPFIWLNPEFAYNGGFRFWADKFADILRLIVQRQGVSYLDALSILAKRVAVLQYWPYHGPSLDFTRGLKDKLGSSELAVRYVHEVLVPRVEANEILLISVRKCDGWGVRQYRRLRNLIIYEGSHVRGASLTLKSAGGKAIVRHMGLTE